MRCSRYHFIASVGLLVGLSPLAIACGGGDDSTSTPIKVSAAGTSGAAGGGSTAATTGVAGDGTIPPGACTEGAEQGKCDKAAGLIDDFEGCDASNSWYNYDPASDTDKTNYYAVSAVAGGKGNSLEIKATKPIVLVRELTTDRDKCWTAVGASAIKLSIKSDKARQITLRLTMPENTPVGEMPGGACVVDAANDMCSDYHQATLSLDAGWKDYTISQSGFMQEGFGKVVDLDLSRALALEVDLADAAGTEIALDNVQLVAGGGTVINGKACACGGPNKPFGSKPSAYASGAIKPAGITDQAVAEAYNRWKGKYLKQACGGWVVDTSSDITGALTVSEAMGYGMLIEAYMAGQDPDAKAIFDGLWAVTRKSTSATDSAFMSWKLSSACSAIEGNQSATDGDMDIAYALLLADRQWGSCDSIKYRDEAGTIISHLMTSLATPNGQKFMYMGDWVRGGDSAIDKTTMRTSDFMPDHYRAFKAATGDAAWDSLRTNVYASFAKAQAANTGLVADFIVGMDSTPSNASGQVLESPQDANFSNNASRVPWRIGVDYLISGDTSAKTFLDKLSTWASNTTSNSPASFMGNYIPATGISNSSSTQGALYYTGPLGVGAMVDSSHQDWANACWDFTKGGGDSVYFQDTLRVLTMIAMTGNWWSPATISCE